jgi:hypothetical protein
MRQNLQQNVVWVHPTFIWSYSKLHSIARITTVQELHEEIEDIYEKNKYAAIN